MMSVEPTPSSTTASTMSPAAWLSIWQTESDDETLLEAALTHLLRDIDAVWHQVAQALPNLEAEARPTLQPLAARLASRVLYHLQDPEAALSLALAAGWDVRQTIGASEDTPSYRAYQECLCRTALDAYIAQQRAVQESAVSGSTAPEVGATTTTSAAPSLDQLRPLVHALLQSAVDDHQYEYAVGVCLDAHELDPLPGILAAGGLDLCRHALSLALTTTNSSSSSATTAKAVQAIANRAKTLDETLPAAYVQATCGQWLGDAPSVAAVLQSLMTVTTTESGSSDAHGTALQIALDVHDRDAPFGAAVATHLGTLSLSGHTYDQALKVLSGGFCHQVSLSFLHAHSAHDPLAMPLLQKTLEERSSGSRSSLLHNAAVVTHGYLHAGTTNDSFLRENLEWMKKASNWAKFTATASLGVVHANHVTEAKQLLEPYLPDDPTDATTVSPAGGYAEGGSLYALGLVHAKQPSTETTDYLRSHLRVSHANEVISHGACLAVGLTAMGTANAEICNELKEVLDTDSAVAGEAAGMAIGMVLVGTGAANPADHSLTDHAGELTELVQELRSYARETAHEKIIRGIAMGLALTCYGQADRADATIEELRSDRDPILRYGAQYATALAYCGTGSNKAVRSLLHTAVSDVNDDVRMAAVIGLAFVLHQTPERVPELTRLLLESFNAHVRYASCMAVGIAMAGTGDPASISLLEPMLDDMVDYVRQGALMGTAMIYMQQSDTCHGRRIRIFREKLSTIVSEKHQSSLTKMGAILSLGLLDSGGRNCALQLGAGTGFSRRTAAVGLALWLQHWHWYPLLHMWSVALTPTVTMGVTQDFKYPKSFRMTCHAKPSQFAYPKKLEEKKEKEKKRVETVTLSTTAKEKARLARKKAKDDGSDGDAAAAGADDTMDVDVKEEEAVEPEKPKRKKREPEPTSFAVSNPARVTLDQSKVCVWNTDTTTTSAARPVDPDRRPYGIFVLSMGDKSDDDEDWGVVQPPSLQPAGELAPPEAFVWTPPPLEPPTAAASADPSTSTDAAE